MSKLQRRVDTIDRLLLRLDGEAAEKLKFERRSLLRRIHKIPQGIILPLDWKPQ
jgi:hypothetical protein